MKSSVRLKRFVPFALVSALVWISPAPHAGVISLLKGDQQKEPQKSFQKVGFVGCAKVKEVTGTVEFLNGIDHWIPLMTGAHLREGDVIRASQGHALLQMCESASLVKITPRTIARLVPLKSGWDRSALSGSEERPGYVVRSVRGKAYIRTAQMRWRALAVNDVLPTGTVIRTDETALVDIFNPQEGRTLRIHSGGEAQLGDEPARTRDRFVAVAGGK